MNSCPMDWYNLLRGSSDINMFLLFLFHQKEPISTTAAYKNLGKLESRIEGVFV